MLWSVSIKTRTFASVNTCNGSFLSCLKLLTQYRTIEQMCSDAHSITLNVYIVNHKGIVHDKQSLMIIVSSVWSAFRCVNTIQKVRGTVSCVVQVQRGRRDNTILHRQNRLPSFQNEYFLYFLTIKAYWLEERSLLDTAIMWKSTSRKQVTNRRFIAVISRVNAF